jgi:hypothetical protein
LDAENIPAFREQNSRYYVFSECARRVRLPAISRGRDRAFFISWEKSMKMFNLAAILVALIVNCGAVHAQNMPTPKPEDAERDAFQTPTAGKNVPAPENNKEPHPGANPESRMNDNPPPQERVGAPNSAPK